MESLERTNLPLQDVCEARLNRADQFLREVFMPAMEGEKALSPADLEVMLGEFRGQYSGPGSDFDISHVWGKSF